jgi:hypothetical protein
MADEDTAFHGQFTAKSDDVVGIALEGCIIDGIIGPEIGPARTDMVEKDDAMIGLEGRRHEAPHVLVAAEAMGEHHGGRAAAAHFGVVPLQSRHRGIPCREKCPISSRAWSAPLSGGRFRPGS